MDYEIVYLFCVCDDWTEILYTYYDLLLFKKKIFFPFFFIKTYDLTHGSYPVARCNKHLT